MNKKIEIYTDGSSLGNPGPGGWGSVFVENNTIIKELGGFDKDTTNNRMELMAVIETLKYISENNKKDNITIFADSNYVLSGITSWIFNWEKNGWRNGWMKIRCMNLFAAIQNYILTTHGDRQIKERVKYV
jgi:ribonuclease HI